MIDLKIIFCAALVAGAFVFGWRGGGLYERSRFNDFITELNAQNLELKSLVKATELKLESNVKDAENKINDATRAIDANYNDAVSVLDNAVSSSSDNSVPSSTSTASNNKESKCRCDCANERKLRELYKKQLEIARDCDITSAHYNELIDLYNALR